jgi:hypothetical protein
MLRNTPFHLLLGATLAFAAPSAQAANGYGIGGQSSGHSANSVQVSPNCTQEGGANSTSITCTNGTVRCTTTYTGSTARTVCLNFARQPARDYFNPYLIDDSLAARPGG